MANLQKRRWRKRPPKGRSQNVTGNFYVDETCIDCDTCRWMAKRPCLRLFHEY